MVKSRALIYALRGGFHPAPEHFRHTPGLCDTPTRRERLLSIEDRSEEHTSELQSQSNLVCRLLLEKKKKDPTKSSDTCSPEDSAKRASPRQPQSSQYKPHVQNPRHGPTPALHPVTGHLVWKRASAT